jgi:hypothetical protein
VQRIDVEAATGLLASRYAPERYQEGAQAGMVPRSRLECSTPVKES